MNDTNVAPSETENSGDAVAEGGVSRGQAEPFRWSKDYVEHLRTVHFTLVVICIALIAVASSDSRNEISDAREQLQLITEALHSWDVAALTKAAANRIAVFNTAQHQSLPTQMFGNPLIDVHTLSIARHGSSAETSVTAKLQGNWMIDGPYRVAHSSTQQFFFGTTLLDDPHLYVAEPHTLAGFQHLWDDLAKENQIIVPTKLAEVMYTFKLPPDGLVHVETIDTLFERTNIRFNPPSPTTPGGTCTLSLARATLKQNMNVFEEAFSKPTPYMYVCEELSPIGTNNLSFIPVSEFKQIALDGQDILLEKIHAQQVNHTKGLLIPHGTFAHSFRALNSVTQNYQTLSLDSFDPILQSEEQRSGESFEALGVKFPADETSRWGTLVVMTVQLYLYLLLRRRSASLRPRDPALEVAWLGLFPSTAARIVALTSIALLPLFVVAYLAVRTFELGHVTSFYRFALLVSILSSAALAVLCLKVFPSKQNS